MSAPHSSKDKVNDFGMRCPQCKNHVQLKVEISVWAIINSQIERIVDLEGQELGWNKKSRCGCENCGYIATVKQFTIE